MAESNAEGGYEARNSIQINPLGVKAQYPVVDDVWKITPDKAKDWYKKVMLDPYKNMEVSGEGSSKTYIDTPDSSYRVGKTRFNKGVLASKPVATIDFGMPAGNGNTLYSRQHADFIKAKAKPGTELRFYQDYDDKLRRNALKAMLGRQIDDIRPGTQLRVGAYNSDGGGKARQRIYSQGTRGALAFGPMGNAHATRLGRNTWKRSDNENVTFDPKDLKKPLKEMTKQQVTRYLLKMTPLARQIPVMNALMTGADLGQLMVDTLDKNTSSSGRGGGRSALND